jgi:hypothetical protein
VPVAAADLEPEHVAEAPVREDVDHRADLDRAHAHRAAHERPGGKRHEIVHRLSRLPDSPAANLESAFVSRARIGGSGSR